MKSVNEGLSAVECDKTGQKPISLYEAMNMVSKYTGVTNFKHTLNPYQVEQNQIDALNPNLKHEERLKQKIAAQNAYKAELNQHITEKEKQLGRKLSSNEIKQLEASILFDKAIAEIAGAPSKVYQKLTGVDKKTGPYAHVIMDFLGGMAASYPALAKQFMVAKLGLGSYINDVKNNAPENLKLLGKSLCFWEAGISPEERFARTLNVAGLVIGGLVGKKSFQSSKFFKELELSKTEKIVLDEWIAEAKSIYKADQSPMGLLNKPHIDRQIDVLDSNPSKAWFAIAKKYGFNLDEAKAAVYGTDITKFNPELTQSALGIGTDNPKLNKLGHVPSDLKIDNPLANLFAHSEAGARFSFDRIKQIAKKNGMTDAQAEALALKVVKHVVGHDSFRYGFGEDFLKPTLSKISNIDSSKINYPMSKTPTGFVVQIIDRIEATLPETQLRYVKEGVVNRKSSITASIDSGVVDGYKNLKKTYIGLLADAKSVMNPTQYQVFLKSPFVKSMEAGLVKFENSLKLLRKNENGFYEINHKVNGKDRWIEIKDLETFEKHYVDAVKADRNSRIKPKDDTSAKKAG